MNPGHLVEEALVYIDEVRKCFPHRPEMCQDFLVLVRNFESEMLTKEDLLRNIDRLFEQNHELCEKFNKFFTAECAELGFSKKTSPFHQAHAMQYVIKVRNRFLSDPEVYSAFLKVLTIFNKGVASHSSVLCDIAALFHGHDDLLMEFTCFIPIAEQQKARDYMQSIIDQNATTTSGIETACVTPTHARTGDTVSNAGGVTAEQDHDQAPKDGGLALTLDARTTTHCKGRESGGTEKNGKRKWQPRNTAAERACTSIVPALADEAPSTPTKPPRKRRNITTDAADPAHAAHPRGDTQVLTEEEVRERRLSALECRVEWQHRRLFDLTNQVRDLEAALAGAGVTPTFCAAKTGGAIAMTTGDLSG